MSGYWKLSSKVVDSALSKIGKTTSGIYKKSDILQCLPSIKTFDQVILKGTNSGDFQQIISLKDKNGSLVGRIIHKTQNGIQTDISQQFFGNFSSGRTMNEVTSIGNRTISSRIEHIKKLFNGDICRNTTETVTNKNGTQTCRSLLGGFSKKGKKVVNFKYLRNRNGFIKNGSLKITNGTEFLQDVPKEYLPLIASGEESNKIKDALLIQLKKRKITNRPKLEIVENSFNPQADNFILGGCAVFGTAKKAGQSCEKLINYDIPGFIKEEMRVGIPTILIPKFIGRLEPQKISGTVAHEIDHLKRIIYGLITSEDRALIEQSAQSWWTKMTKGLKRIKPNSAALQRQNNYYESLRTEAISQITAQFKNTFGELEIMQRFLKMFPKELSYKEYNELAGEVIARKAESRESNYVLNRVIRPINERIFGITS